MYLSIYKTQYNSIKKVDLEPYFSNRRDIQLKKQEETSFSMKEPIGFIGTGIMGASIISHLIKKNFPVFIYNRTKTKAEHLINLGAKWVDKPSEITQTSKIIFTMLGYPEDVKKVYLSNSGLINHAKENTVFIDMTTSSPTLAKEIFLASKQKNCISLDAPVSGGDSGARNGTLSIMVGGEQSAYQQILPILETFGKTIVYQGATGAGQHTKLTNQILIASYMIGVCEALQYATKNGLNPNTVLESVSGGAAQSWSLVNLAPKMLLGDYTPGFYIHHFIKDMQLAVDECEHIKLTLHNLLNSLTLYKKLPDDFKQTKGTQAIYELFK